MYDANNERHEFVGDERADAVAKACEFFGVDEDKLKIAEMKPGEIHGLASRAVVAHEFVSLVRCVVHQLPPGAAGSSAMVCAFRRASRAPDQAFRIFLPISSWCETASTLLTIQ